MALTSLMANPVESTEYPHNVSLRASGFEVQYSEEKEEGHLSFASLQYEKAEEESDYVNDRSCFCLLGTI